jgi:Leucine-rich repeat (LRR) protein
MFGLVLNFVRNLNGQPSNGGFPLCKLPDSIGSLSELEYFNLNSMKAMTGGIPETIGNLARLRYLKIQQNSGYATSRVGGMIPASMGNLTNLEYLELDRIGLTGEIPELGGLKNLTTFIINDNRMTGSIPASFSQMSKLVTFSAANTQLQGKVPEFSPSLISCDISLGHFACSHKNNTVCAGKGIQGQLIAI